MSRVRNGRGKAQVVRRCLPLIVASLMIGAIASIVVAWACAIAEQRAEWLERMRPQELSIGWKRSDYQPPPSPPPPPISRRQHRDWERFGFPASPPVRSVERTGAFGYECDRLDAYNFAPHDAGIAVWNGREWAVPSDLDSPSIFKQIASIDVDVTRVGWPCRCLVGSRATMRNGGAMGGWSRQSSRFTFHVSHERLGEAALPWCPTPGLIVNAIVYALPMMLLLSVIGRARGAWRVARGRCVRCRYLVMDLERCPECGTTVTRRRGA